MANPLDRAVTMARDLAELELARSIVREIIRSTRALPPADRESHANLMLHKRLIAEMCEYNDRLKIHVENTMRAALAALDQPCP